MKQAYFITGTDTGVGKTFITTALLQHFNKLGRSTVAMKPIAAGCIKTNQGWVNEDVEALRANTTVALTSQQVCPYLLASPIAPHIAAEEENVKIDLNVIYDKFLSLKEHGDTILVEGVGGFQVPLDDQYDTADLAVMLGLPVILVVGLRLGCLNHALLTAESIRARGLPLAGWVANQIDPAMQRIQQNIATLKARLGCPLLSTAPFFSKPSIEEIQFNL